MKFQSTISPLHNTKQPQIPDNLSFTFHLLTLLSENENSVISPFGIASVLAMASEGSTRRAVEEILHTLNVATMDDLRKIVQQRNTCLAFTSENSVTLKQGSENLHFLNTYLTTLADQYQAQTQEVKSVGTTSVALMNIASFKAQWLHKMGRDASHDYSFHNADNTATHPAFLSCEEKTLSAYTDYDGTAAVSLPYQLNGEELPYVLTLVMSRDTLDIHTLERILGRMHPQKCTIRFPAFTIENTLNLVPMMKLLGLNLIFDSKIAPLSHICDQPLYASSFTQQAKIEVDQEGTVAKAITAMCLTSKCISENTKIIFNQPFVYLLQDINANRILFAGKVNKLNDCERTEGTVNSCLDWTSFPIF